MKILALLPSYKIMDIPAVQSLVSLQADVFKRGDNINIIFCNGFNAAKARTLLMEYASNQGGVDYIVNIDTDNVYEADDLYAIIDKMEANNMEMLSAAYLVKDSSGYYAHGRFLEDGSFEKVHARETGGIIDCDVLGFGFLVMKHSFVKKMVDTYKDDLFLFDIKDNSTEDVYFCRQAKKIGTRIAFDSDTLVGHLMTVIQK
jgi:hypothetical protein